MKRQIAALAALTLCTFTPAMAGGVVSAGGGYGYAPGGVVSAGGYGYPGGIISPGPSYAPNYQFNSPGNMMRMAPNSYYSPYGYGVSPYGYGTPYGVGVSPYGISPYAPGLMWRAPSGYSYPWMYNQNTTYMSPVTTSLQGASSQSSQPPLNTMLSDMVGYLDSQHKEGKLADGDYQSMKRRALDLQSKLQDVMSQQDGVLDAETERQLRKDANQLGSELSHRVQP